MNDDGVKVGRAVLQGVLAGAIAAVVFYFAYQAILHTLFSEMDKATRQEGGTNGRPAAAGGDDVDGDGIGRDRFGESGGSGGE